MNKYEEMKTRHQKEFNELPIKFAFGNDQFRKMLNEFGLGEAETDKLIGIGSGGYCLKTDYHKVREWSERTCAEVDDAIKADKTGEGFIFDMFYNELSDHEFIVTMDEEYTLDRLGYTIQDIAKDKRLRHGLEIAKESIVSEHEQSKSMEMDM